MARLDPADPEMTEPTRPDLADTDGDGLSDLREKELTTNPLSIDSDADGLSDSLEIGGYEVVIGDQAIVVNSDPLNPDTDGDQLTDSAERDGSSIFVNAEERRRSTNPTVADTDGDGLDDLAEITGLPFEGGTYHTDPVVSDTDADGLTDAEEAARSTHPTVADTDEDGLKDGAEITAGTDPRNPDTDNDTRTDGEEVNGYRVNFWGISREVDSNPAASDTDRDGWSDANDFFPRIWMPMWLPPDPDHAVLWCCSSCSYQRRSTSGLGRDQAASRPYEPLAMDLGSITHGYLTVENLTRYPEQPAARGTGTVQREDG